MWDFSSLEIVKVYNFNHVVEEAVFSKDQSLIAVGGHADNVIVLNFPLFNQNKTLSTGHTIVRDLDFNFVSDRLLTCGDDGKFKTWKNTVDWSNEYNLTSADEIKTCEFSKNNDILGGGNSFVEAWSLGVRNFQDYSNSSYANF